MRSTTMAQVKNRLLAEMTREACGSALIGEQQVDEGAELLIAMAARRGRFELPRCTAPTQSMSKWYTPV